MKRIIGILAAVWMFFTGCAFNSGIDTLLTPPKLSAQQEQIYNALKEYVGTNISLKYPKSGDYLSAFIIADIDLDGRDESIVFYEKNTLKTDDNTLRINILDQVDGKWKSVYDYAAAGAEVEKVIISPLGNNEKVNIITGCSLINQSEKVVTIYDYSNGVLNTNFENNYYSVFDAQDIDGDGAKELFIALGQSSSKDASAAVYKLGENGEYTEATVSLSEGYSDYSGISYGSLDSETKGIYLDAVSGGNVITEVLYMEDGILRRLFSNKQAQETYRAASYLSKDVDGDGEIEIPIPSVLSGYQDYPEKERLSITDWYCLKNDSLVKRLSSYYSISNGYNFIIPEKWIGKVTAVYDSDNDELTFCRYQGAIHDKLPVLFKMCVASDSEKSDSLAADGYTLIRTKGNKQFWLWINDSDSFIDSPSELMFNFIFDT